MTAYYVEISLLSIPGQPFENVVAQSYFQIDEEQCAFRISRSCVGQVSGLRVVSEKYIWKLRIHSIDLGKAYDRIAT